MMDTVRQLNREFSAQDFSEGQPYVLMLDRYRNVAADYAAMENAIAVLSDLRANVSYVYYGGFSRTLGLERSGGERVVSSIWEDDVFGTIHPDDLSRKYLQELSFFRFVKGQPKRNRPDYCLMSRLRMKSVDHGYVPVLHRIFYISVPANGTMWLAMCLYTPMFFEMPGNCLIVNSANGRTTELDEHNRTGIITPREKQTLQLIERGLASKEIATMLSISINTVNRHRQEILRKLRVKNSIEACRMAKSLGLL